jgi:cyclopropane-fatty-acyl-phospholipid synthase
MSTHKPASQARAPLGASLARKALQRALQHMRFGQLSVHDPDGSVHTFGTADERGLRVSLRVHDWRFYSQCAASGTLGAGESYVDGLWDCDELTDLFRLMVLNRGSMRSLDSGWAKLMLPLRRIKQAFLANTREGSKRNIAAHYDLSNDFFSLMLDPTMMYSCAFFTHESATLEEASTEKLDMICRKLRLHPQDHVLEIGTGWGGFAIHAAKNYGCTITTTTISKEQAKLARERIAAAGLASKVTVIESDYRDLTGTYDKLVSIEMIEAIGSEYLDTFFAKCESLLKPEGRMVLQAITMQDRDYERALHEVDFIQKHIFPGSFIPSLGAMQQSVARVTAMRVIDIQDIGPHYARTLHAWRDAFFAKLPEVRALGFDDRFVRMWNYYLCYCEGGFIERHLGDAHLVLVRELNRDIDWSAAGSSNPAPLLAGHQHA